MPKGVVLFLSMLVLSANLGGSGTVPTHANYNLHACKHAILLYKCFKHHFDFCIRSKMVIVNDRSMELQLDKN